MRVLQRYRYFQPIDGRLRYFSAADGRDMSAYSLSYSGAIPADGDEPTEEVLERLLLRHASQLRPQGRGSRPVGAGDVFDLSERGLWQVLPIGFRALEAEPLALSGVN